MKTIRITTLIAASLLLSGTTFARGGPGGNGRGFGGPPANDEERAARQAERGNAKDGECDGSGQQTKQRQRKGAGKGNGGGARDGSGPQGGNGNCPAGT